MPTTNPPVDLSAADSWEKLARDVVAWVEGLAGFAVDFRFESEAVKAFRSRRARLASGGRAEPMVLPVCRGCGGLGHVDCGQCDGTGIPNESTAPSEGRGAETLRIDPDLARRVAEGEGIPVGAMEGPPDDMTPEQQRAHGWRWHSKIIHDFAKDWLTLRAALTAAEAERDQCSYALTVANLQAKAAESQREEAVTLAGEAIGLAHDIAGTLEALGDCTNPSPCKQCEALTQHLDTVCAQAARLAKLTKEGT